MNKTEMQELIDIIKNMQFQCETKWQCGYQKALNDVLFEANKLNIELSGNIKASKDLNCGNSVVNKTFFLNK
jgi:hypothetical protein